MMREAARLLVGEHDFLGFSSVRRTNKSTVRCIREIRIEKQERQLRLVFVGDGFLYHMVRILTGTLAEIGAGKRAPQSVEDVFLSKNREMAGVMAPPQGLCLENVRYM